MFRVQGTEWAFKTEIIHTSIQTSDGGIDLNANQKLPENCTYGTKFASNRCVSVMHLN